MPRNAFRLPRAARACGIAIGVVALGLVPPQTLRAALAAAAGTLFESLPFVIAGVLLPRAFGRSRRARPFLQAILDLASCGCRASEGRLRALAFSLPAFALTCSTFGWWAAFARVASLVALDAIWRARPRREREASMRDRAHSPKDGECDAFDAVGRVASPRHEIVVQFEGLAVATAVGALVAELIRESTANAGSVFISMSPPLAFALWIVGFGIGAVAGASAPCATAGVALASLLRGVHPALAFGALVSAGIAPIGMRRAARMRQATSHRATTRCSTTPDEIARDARRDAARLGDDDRIVLLALALSALVLVVTREGGFVNSRLLIPITLAAVACAWVAVNPVNELRDHVQISNATTRAMHMRSLVAPAIMLAALGLGSPPPSGAIVSALDDVTPGDPMQTVGILRAHGTMLVRAMIVCCRADARLVGVRLAHRDAHADGTWLRARGIVRDDHGALELDAAEARQVAPPHDPFIYF